MKFPSLFLCLLCAAITFVFVSCSRDGGSDALSDGEFRHVYSEIIYLGELYRGDTLRLRAAVDSLLEEHDADTAALFAAARRTAQDRELTEALYRETIERFERLTTADSMRVESDTTRASQSGR